MKSVYKLAITIVTALLIGQNALAECAIYVQLCPRYPSLGGIYINDTFEGSAVNPNRCLKRAREYQIHCVTPPNAYVGAYFHQKGRYTVAQTVMANTTTKWATDAAGQVWIPLE